LAYGLFGSFFGSESEVSQGSAPQQPPKNRVEAFAFTNYAIEKQLKAPSTARFASITDEETIIHDLGGDKFTVTSWVDSQNSFGATMRTKYQMTVERKSDGDWTIESVITDP